MEGAHDGHGAGGADLGDAAAHPRLAAPVPEADPLPVEFVGAVGPPQREGGAADPFGFGAVGTGLHQTVPQLLTVRDVGGPQQRTVGAEATGTLVVEDPDGGGQVHGVHGHSVGAGPAEGGQLRGEVGEGVVHVSVGVTEDQGDRSHRVGVAEPVQPRSGLQREFDQHGVGVGRLQDRGNGGGQHRRVVAHPHQEGPRTRGQDPGRGLGGGNRVSLSAHGRVVSWWCSGTALTWWLCVVRDAGCGAGVWVTHHRSGGLGPLPHRLRPRPSDRGEDRSLRRRTVREVSPPGT